MFRIVPIILLALTVQTGVAQDDLAANDLKYLDGFLKECKSRHATYIREIERRDNGRYQATLVSVHGDTVLIGEYSDKTCQVPHGRFAYFHENGQVESMGFYSGSRKVGTWKRFKKDGEAKAFIKYPGKIPEELLRNEESTISESVDEDDEDLAGIPQETEPGSLMATQNTSVQTEEVKQYPTLKDGVELEVRTEGEAPEKMVVSGTSSKASSPARQIMQEVKDDGLTVGPGTGASMIRGVPAIW